LTHFSLVPLFYHPMWHGHFSIFTRFFPNSFHSTLSMRLSLSEEAPPVLAPSLRKQSSIVVLVLSHVARITTSLTSQSQTFCLTSLHPHFSPTTTVASSLTSVQPPGLHLASLLLSLKDTHLSLLFEFSLISLECSLSSLSFSLDLMMSKTGGVWLMWVTATDHRRYLPHSRPPT